MKERFQGDDGRRVLVEVLKDQKIVGGNEALAEEIAAAGELRDVDRDAVLIEQNGEDTDCFLFLSGTFTILVNGKKVATRGPTDHVGEMAAIHPSQRALLPSLRRSLPLF
jgi:CRP/FNR family cyclic AMP-dependent transcriptional regulator